jgi:hypothetical protein
VGMVVLNAEKDYSWGGVGIAPLKTKNKTTI